jgi:hypothetical protein
MPSASRRDKPSKASKNAGRSTPWSTVVGSQSLPRPLGLIEHILPASHFNAKKESNRTKEQHMNFIEQSLGISPDGGSGTWELLLLAVSILAIATLASKCSSRRWVADVFDRR